MRLLMTPPYREMGWSSRTKFFQSLIDHLAPRDAKNRDHLPLRIEVEDDAPAPDPHSPECVEAVQIFRVGGMRPLVEQKNCCSDLALGSWRQRSNLFLRLV